MVDPAWGHPATFLRLRVVPGGRMRPRRCGRAVSESLGARERRQRWRGDLSVRSAWRWQGQSPPCPGHPRAQVQAPWMAGQGAPGAEPGPSPGVTLDLSEDVTIPCQPCRCPVSIPQPSPCHGPTSTPLPHLHPMAVSPSYGPIFIPPSSSSQHCPRPSTVPIPPLSPSQHCPRPATVPVPLLPPSLRQLHARGWLPPAAPRPSSVTSVLQPGQAG